MDEAGRLRGAGAIEERFGAHLPILGERLEGKVAMVTGAGSAGEVLGTGAATAILFAAQGAAVALFDVDKARAETTLGLIEGFGGRATVIAGDQRKAADCRAAVQAATERFGGLDILVNNAAVVRGGDVQTVKEADWDVTIDVNLKGVLLMSQAAAPALVARRGAIVSISSSAAVQGYGVIGYAAAKGGVISMTFDMAASLGRQGVRVNCLTPGHLATPMGRVHDAKRRSERLRSIMLDTEGDAWDIAWASLFLAGAEARWITGANLLVDAGSTVVPGVKLVEEYAS